MPLLRWQHPKIGFDDRLVTLVGVPVMSFFIPLMFFGLGFRHAPYYTWKCYGMTLTTTTLIWIGVRYLMIWARLRYPLFVQNRKRLLIQSTAILVFALGANNLLGMGMDYICIHYFPQEQQMINLDDLHMGSNFAAIFCTLTIVAVYESIYFMGALRESVEETELLKRASLQAQLSALKTQVNPHFLFNNLNTLSAIIPDDPRAAVDFVQQLSRVYRHILEVRDEQSIQLKEELEVLEAYAFLLKTRYGRNLDIDIQAEAGQLEQRVVPLSLQILMENAIKHNIVSAARPLSIRVYAENGRLVVRNTLQKKLQPVESTGLGLDNIRNRYRLLGGEVEVREESSSFTVYIPLLCAQ